MKQKKILCLALALCLLVGLVCSSSVLPAGANDSYAALSYESAGINQDVVDASLMSMGDSTRLAAVMKRAAAGEEITIGFIGGSITYGSGVIDKGGTANDRFSNLVQAWFADRFPQATVNLVNCALPETGSLMGQFRVEDELLQYNPDLVVIEFAVNDGGSYGNRESTEALIRACMDRENDPAVMMLMMATGSGWNSQTDKAINGSYYNLPMVSFKNGIDKVVELGLGTRKDFDSDGTHPNIKGHAATALFMINWLEKVYADYETINTDTIPALPDPMFDEDLKHVEVFGNTNITPVSKGSFVETNNASIYSYFKNGWQVTDGGKEAITFEVEAKRVYVASLLGPTHDGTALVTVNGAPVATWNGYHSYRKQANTLVFESDTTKKVQITVQVVEGSTFVLSGLWVAY